MTVAPGVEAKAGQDDNFDAVAEVAAELAGAAVTAIGRLGGGRNSRVFRIATAKCDFALKQYPSLADDARDRLGTEAAALKWMELHGIEVVPRSWLPTDRAISRY